MMLFDLREPVSALSHGAGMVLALPLIWVFCHRCRTQTVPDATLEERPEAQKLAYQRGKIATLVIFGSSLIICYGNSALYHAVYLGGAPLSTLRKLDHLGIYLLIAGTYTPAAWSLMPPLWRRGTLLSVWSVAACCGFRVWTGGLFPTWVSTLIYLTMGWGVLFCYRELARNLSYRRLQPLALGGAFYSVGALINLAGWPALNPGVFGAHELFHLFVLGGSSCHVYFMLRVVVPARPSASWYQRDRDVTVWLPSSLAHWIRPSSRNQRVSPQQGGTLFRRPHLPTGAEPESNAVVVRHPVAAVGAET
jgi:hemolysin III